MILQEYFLCLLKDQKMSVLFNFFHWYIVINGNWVSDITSLVFAFNFIHYIKNYPFAKMIFFHKILSQNVLIPHSATLQQNISKMLFVLNFLKFLFSKFLEQKNANSYKHHYYLTFCNQSKQVCYLSNIPLHLKRTVSNFLLLIIGELNNTIKAVQYC